ncbi:MAG: hypothetical protein DWQ07_13520 [Chloroflexi bacterium]|nr:MAG: hypothetical protein DWQ07_13520 [Chloroflexota bacterium]MBL1196744.1 hypothetical protein [Chloroflexota bacterium]NOH14038.1 hypothetical protein [Chloroflexota bacterium]
MNKSSIPPVEKTITVPLELSEAFKLFTDGIGTWWPLHRHSVDGENSSDCQIEGFVGGRFYEIMKDGSQAEWGKVMAWLPPHRLVVTWHPGREAETAQELEISFSTVAEGTQVHLLHRGWEILGEAAEEARQQYVPGWDFVLGHYITAANKKPVE